MVEYGVVVFVFVYDGIGKIFGGYFGCDIVWCECVDVDVVGCIVCGECVG